MGQSISAFGCQAHPGTSESLVVLVKTTWQISYYFCCWHIIHYKKFVFFFLIWTHVVDGYFVSLTWLSTRSPTTSENCIFVVVIQVKADKVWHIFSRQNWVAVYLSLAIRTKFNTDTTCDVSLRHIPFLQTTDAKGSACLLKVHKAASWSLRDLSLPTRV